MADKLRAYIPGEAIGQALPITPDLLPRTLGDILPRLADPEFSEIASGSGHVVLSAGGRSKEFDPLTTTLREIDEFFAGQQDQISVHLAVNVSGGQEGA